MWSHPSTQNTFSSVDGKSNSPARARTWRRLEWLAINQSTLALLGAIFLVSAATELWSPLIPNYLKDLQSPNGQLTTRLILLVGLYGLLHDALEAVNYFVGGAIGAWINTRRALILFNIVPLAGLAMLCFAKNWLGVFVAIPFVLLWNSLSGPAVISVVGESVAPARRTMAFSLQSIFKRLSRILVYSISGLSIWFWGSATGFRVNVVCAAGFVMLAIFIQFRYQRTAFVDQHTLIHRPLVLLRRFDPQLKRLLVSDILSRWAEGMAGPFIILFCVPILSHRASDGVAAYSWYLLSIQAATSMVLYLIIGPLASREGLAKKPYIGLTFLFFALFPIGIALLGPSFGFWGLVVAFVLGGAREIGEPARKAMVADLVPPELRTQSIGLYWSIRSLAVMLASPIGALLWIIGERWSKGLGPYCTFLAAGLVGAIGAVVFFIRFGRDSLHDGMRPDAMN